MKRLFFILLLSIMLTQAAVAETIHLKSGQTIVGPIIERSDDHIKINIEGVGLTYYTDQIQSISTETLVPPSLLPAQGNAPAAPPFDFETIKTTAMAAIVVVDSILEDHRVTGTGFFISADGLIVTNLHVILNAKNVEIITHAGRSYPIQYIANYSDDHDICLLKINIDHQPVLSIGNSDQLETGQFVFTVGHREGARYEFSSGTYIGKKIIESQENIQSKLVTGHGNSGGPIMDKYGKVIGISTLFTAEGYNLSLPINTAKQYFNFNQVMTLADLKKKIQGPFSLTFAANGDYLEGRYGPALIKFKQALAQDPNYFKAWLGAARAYTAMSMNDEAFEAWTQVVTRATNHAEGHARLGKLYLDKNLIEEAISHLEMATQLDAEQPLWVYEDLAFTYGKKGEFEKAVEAYRRAIKIDPASGSAYYNLAVAYFNHRDFAQAQQYSDEAQKRNYPVPESFLKMLKEPKTFKLF